MHRRCCPLSLALLLVTGGCPSEQRPWWQFPEGFLFGSATAGFQVEMGCPSGAPACVDRRSDWYAYVTSPKMRAQPSAHISGGDPATTGPGHWELYEGDYDLARQELGNNAFRISVEWSRIFPTSTEGIERHEDLLAAADRSALEHYRRMLAAMRARGLEPMVTLHHYTLPLWLHDGVACHEDLAGCEDRGWLDPARIVPEAAKYAGFIARELGELVDTWATQNEPFAVITSAFLQPSAERTNPPAVFLQHEAARTALLAMVDAHARMTDAVREGDTADADGDGAAAQVGLVYALAPFLPRDPSSALDRRAADNGFYLWNLLFLDATAAGRLDRQLDGRQVYREDLAGRMDFIGVNYKMSARVQGLDRSFLPELSPLLTINPLLIGMDEIHPRGLFEVCQLLQRRYGLPLYLTENNGRQMWRGDEALEARYMTENLQWVAHAVDAGVDIRGYFYWAFVDNYEWNHGMNVKLGLYAVDADDPQRRRVARSISRRYGAIAGAGAVGAALRTEFPIDRDAPPTGGVPGDATFIP